MVRWRRDPNSRRARLRASGRGRERVTIKVSRLAPSRENQRGTPCEPGVEAAAETGDAMQLETAQQDLDDAKKLVAELKRWGNHTQLEVQVVQTLEHLTRAVQALVEQAAK